MPDSEDGLVHSLQHAQELGSAFALAYIHIARGLAEADMTNPKGTKSETAVVNWAKRQEYWKADRITKGGARSGEDRGDVKLTDQVMVQVKDGYNEGREPTDFQIGKWLAAVDEQKKNGGWEIGLLVHKRAGKADPDMWRWYIDGHTFGKLLGYHGVSMTFPQYVQLQGYMIPPLLRNAGLY